MDLGQVVMMVLVAWAIFAFLGAYISQAKGRPGFEGVVFGVMLGPIGLLITALMPSIKPKEVEPARAAEPAGGPAPAQGDRPRSIRRIGGAGDDKAMDFVMDLIRQEGRGDEGESIPRVPPSKGIRKD